MFEYKKTVLIDFRTVFFASRDKKDIESKDK